MEHLTTANNFLQLLEPNSQLMLVLTGLLLLSFLIHFILWLKTARLTRLNRQLLGGEVEGTPLDQVLVSHMERVKGAELQVAGALQTCHHLEQVVAGCVQQMGVVRFNAFPDTGGDLSFAVALLDGKGSGVVFSSLYGRSESRIYAKPISQGQSSYHLTEEEKTAIAQAIGKQERS